MLTVLNMLLVTASARVIAIPGFEYRKPAACSHYAKSKPLKYSLSEKDKS